MRRKFGKGDLEDISPIRLLIGKKKDLKLSDEQVNKLKELEGKLKEHRHRNVPQQTVVEGEKLGGRG